MTREEAIRILDPATTMEALAEIDYYAGFEGHDAQLAALDEASRIAVAALREQQEAEKNEPLTPEQLRKMDEEPVYIQMGDGRKGYAIIVWECGCLLLCGPIYDEAVTGEPDVDFYNLTSSVDPDGHFGLHKLGWRAYRHKPKEG